jgi:hypothetical protein
MLDSGGARRGRAEGEPEGGGRPGPGVLQEAQGRTWSVPVLGQLQRCGGASVASREHWFFMFFNRFFLRLGGVKKKKAVWH